MATAAMTLVPANRRSSTPSPHPPVVATSNDGVLPLDLLYDILLRLPTEALCRFRAVCRSWRSLLCHPDFIDAAHNPGLLLLAVGIDDYSWTNKFVVVDMESGEGVPVNMADLSYGEACTVSHDHMVCVPGRESRLRLLDLARGTVSLLPDHALPVGSTTSCTSSMGEQKVLAITTIAGGGEQICKILDLGSIDSGWRDTGSPPLRVITHPRCVNGVAYFLSKYGEHKEELHAHHIMAFNLMSEAWLSSLRGPASCRNVILAELEGHLVASYTSSHTHIVEMWFLVDSNRSLWSKRHTIDMSSCHHPPTRYGCFEKPIVMLGDGRIMLWMSVIMPERLGTQDALLWLYDPRTGTFSDRTLILDCNRVIVFTWSLLHPGKRHALDKVAKYLLFGRRGCHQSGLTTSVPGASKTQPTSNLN